MPNARPLFMVSEVCIVMVQLSSAYSVQAARSSAAASNPCVRRFRQHGNNCRDGPFPAAARARPSLPALPPPTEAYRSKYYAIPPDWQNRPHARPNCQGKLGARATTGFTSKGGNLLGTHPSRVAECSAADSTPDLAAEGKVSDASQYHQALVVDKGQQ